MLIATLAFLDLDARPENFWTAWSWPLVPGALLALTLLLYVAGWRAASRTRPRQLPTWRMACFVGGIVLLWIAIASPIDALDDYLDVGGAAVDCAGGAHGSAIARPARTGAPRLVAAVSGALAPERAEIFHASGLCLAADEHRLSGMARARRI